MNSDLEEVTDDIEHATDFCDVRDLLAYWHAHADGGIPRLSSFDDIMAGAMGSRLMLLAQEGDSIVYRRVGHRIMELFGHDPTGKATDDINNIAAKAFHEPYRLALSTGKPRFLIQRITGKGAAERLLLPVIGDEGLGILVYIRSRNDIIDFLRAIFNASSDALSVMEAVRASDGSIVDFTILATNAESGRRLKLEPDAMIGVSFLANWPTAMSNGAFDRMRHAVEVQQTDVFDTTYPLFDQIAERRLRLVPQGERLTVSNTDMGPVRSATRALEHQRNELFAANALLERRAADLTASYDSLEKTTQELRNEIQRNRTLERELIHLARYDGLTGLPNRSFFELSFEEKLRAPEAPRRAVFGIVDVDHFKDINDGLGHNAGDAVLREVARRLTGAMDPLDLCGRMGGDEFAMLILDGAEGENIERAVKRVSDALSSPFSYNRQSTSVAASIGIAIYPDDGTTMSELMAAADIALYRAKRGGRNQAVVFSSGMREDSDRRASLQRRLRQAIGAGEIVPYYQPLMDLRTGQVIGFEALARWHHPEAGLLLPSSFIDGLEEVDIAQALTRTMIKEVASDLASWRNTPVPAHASVNVTTFDLRQPGFAEELRKTVAEHGLERRQLAIEVTETTMLSRDGERITQTLTELRQLGFSVSLDDFGTGYASLSHLLTLPADSLKIDKSFAEGVENNTKTAAIVRSLVAMAAALGLDVVQEGIETRAQLDAVRSLGCQIVQGYLIAEPMPRDTVVDFVRHFDGHRSRGSSPAAA